MLGLHCIRAMRNCLDLDLAGQFLGNNLLGNDNVENTILQAGRDVIRVHIIRADKGASKGSLHSLGPVVTLGLTSLLLGLLVLTLDAQDPLLLIVGAADLVRLHSRGICMNLVREDSQSGLSHHIRYCHLALTSNASSDSTMSMG